MVCKENQLTEACEKFARFSPIIVLNHSIPAFEHRQVEQYLQQKEPVGIGARRKKKEPRMVESEMAHKNSAEICSSPPESEVDDSRCC